MAFDSKQDITALYAKNGSSYYALRSAQVSLQLSSSSMCNISVICKIPKKRISSGYKQETLDVDSSFNEVWNGFKYGDRVQVYQNGSKGKLLLYDGYVTSVGSTLSSAINAYAFGCEIVLQSPAALYSAIYSGAGALYITQYGGANSYFKNLGAIAAKNIARTVAADKFSDPYNPAAFAAKYIDAVSDTRKTNVGGGFSDTSKSYEKLSSFIDINNSPTLNISITQGLGGVGRETQKQSTALARITSDDIIAGLQSDTGLGVFVAHISQFGLTLAPRMSSTTAGEPKMSVIQNIGINSKVKLKITPDQILGYNYQPPAHVLGEFQAVAVSTNTANAPAGDGSAVGYVLWAAGYDNSGNPKLHKGIKINAHKDKGQAGSPSIKAVGPVTVIGLPKWLSSAVPLGKGNKPAAVFEKYASAAAKTYYAQGLGSPGRLTIDLLYSELPEVYNHIGDEASIDLSSVSEGKGTKIPIRYGRLIGVYYQISATATEFSARCSLSFDCVCNKKEFDTFKVSGDDLLCK